MGSSVMSCSTGKIFTILEEAKVLIEQWQMKYNQVRHHNALGYQPAAPEAILTVT